MFAQIWDDIGGEEGDPLHVCVLAHATADVQDDVHQELMWDLRALTAADLTTPRRTLHQLLIRADRAAGECEADDRKAVKPEWSSR